MNLCDPSKVDALSSADFQLFLIAPVFIFILRKGYLKGIVVLLVLIFALELHMFHKLSTE
jgi:hypothetical protein